MANGLQVNGVELLRIYTKTAMNDYSVLWPA